MLSLDPNHIYTTGIEGPTSAKLLANWEYLANQFVAGIFGTNGIHQVNLNGDKVDIAGYNITFSNTGITDTNLAHTYLTLQATRDYGLNIFAGDETGSLSLVIDRFHLLNLPFGLNLGGSSLATSNITITNLGYIAFANSNFAGIQLNNAPLFLNDGSGSHATSLHLDGATLFNPGSFNPKLDNTNLSNFFGTQLANYILSTGTNNSTTPQFILGGLTTTIASGTSTLHFTGGRLTSIS